MTRMSAVTADRRTSSCSTGRWRQALLKYQGNRRQSQTVLGIRVDQEGAWKSLRRQLGSQGDDEHRRKLVLELSRLGDDSRASAGLLMTMS